MNSLVESICLSPAPDRWCCSLSGMGDFSMASTCSFIDGKLLPAMSSPSRWIKEVPININVFSWKLALDKLSNGPILDRRVLDLFVLGMSCFVMMLLNLPLISSLFVLYSAIITSQVCQCWGILVPGLTSYADWLAWFKTL